MWPALTVHCDCCGNLTVAAFYLLYCAVVVCTTDRPFPFRRGLFDGSSSVVAIVSREILPSSSVR